MPTGATGAAHKVLTASMLPQLSLGPVLHRGAHGGVLVPQVAGVGNLSDDNAMLYVNTHFLLEAQPV